MKRKKHFKQLSFEQRQIIEDGIRSFLSISAIAKSLDVSTTTVSRELRRNRISQGKKKTKYGPQTDCIHLRTCTKTQICSTRCFNKLCKNCGKACNTKRCEDYAPAICDRCAKAPWVCTGCKRRSNCAFERFDYSAKAAGAMAKDRLIHSRVGFDIDQEEKEKIDLAVQEGFKKGQSLYHIKHAYGLRPSVSTLYRMLSSQAISGVRAIDAPRKVRYKVRKKKKDIHAHPKGFYKGREHEDWLGLPKELRDKTVQGDTVLGKKGEKPCILTLHKTLIKFQFHLYMPTRASLYTVRAFDYLELALFEATHDRYAFEKHFPVFLLDRGCEFDDIKGMESSLLNPGKKRTSCYFCDPSRSDQKGACEKNHVELRKIVPKGTSLLTLDPVTLSVISSHVNSSIRKSIDGRSPYRLALEEFPKEFLDTLGITEIEPKEVILKPNILYKP